MGLVEEIAALLGSKTITTCHPDQPRLPTPPACLPTCLPAGRLARATGPGILPAQPGRPVCSLRANAALALAIAAATAAAGRGMCVIAGGGSSEPCAGAAVALCHST